MEPVHLAPVAAYNSQLEADLVVARLGDSGIRAFVRADGLGGTFPGMPMATGGFQVMVAEADQDRGRAAILEMGSQAADRVSGGLADPAWKWIRWLIPIGALLLLLAGVGSGLGRNVF